MIYITWSEQKSWIQVILLEILENETWTCKSLNWNPSCVRSYSPEQGEQLRNGGPTHPTQPEHQMLSTLCSLTVIEEIIHPIIWKHTHFILCYGWCWSWKEKQARFTEERTWNDLRGFGSKYFHTWEACRYLEVLVAKPITAISHFFPSLRDTWLLKLITLFPQKSMQAILETRVVLSTTDITHTFLKSVVKKAWCLPEAWYERLHQREPGSNKSSRLLRAMNKQIKPQRALPRQTSAHARLALKPLPVFPVESEAFLAEQTAYLKTGIGFG